MKNCDIYIDFLKSQIIAFLTCLTRYLIWISENLILYCRYISRCSIYYACGMHLLKIKAPFVHGSRGGGGGYGVIPEKNYAPGKRGSTPAVNFFIRTKAIFQTFLKNVFYATDRRPTKFTQSIYITIRDS